MSLWPRTLRWRLILAVSFVMIATQLVMVTVATNAYSREQRIERAMQLARLTVFIRHRIDLSQDLPVDIPLPMRSRRPMSHEPLDAHDTTLPPPGATHAPPDKPDFEVPKNNRHRPADFVTAMVTRTLPVKNNDVDLVERMRVQLPELVHVEYQEKHGLLSLAEHLPYVISAWTSLDQGRYLKTTIEIDYPMREPQDAEFPPWLGFMLDFGSRIAMLSLLAFLVTSWVANPLKRLAEAADNTLPNGETKAGAPPLILGGAPAEIADTLNAFERMRGRIGIMVAERTTMLTALAHDLRTPITRLMLRVELSSDTKLRDEAIRDCIKMQTLIASTLDFLRSAEQGKQIANVDLTRAIHAAISSLGGDTYSRVEVDGDNVMIAANGWGVERLFANVIDNAIKYGEYAKVTISRDATFAVVRVADYGKGVPAELLTRLKEPFYRVDSARNLDEGGAGLGMSIVDNLVRAYGGEWSITNAAAMSASTADDRTPTGLVVEIKLPIVQVAARTID